jgi:hypothetical protein
MKYANRISYSDMTPFEVIKEATAKKLVIREMEATRDPEWTPNFTPGGFMAVCTNQNEQKWIIKSCDGYPLVTIREHKDGTFRDNAGNKYRLSNVPVRYFDYNF